MRSCLSWIRASVSDPALHCCATAYSSVIYKVQMGEVFKNYFVLRAYPLPDEVRAGKTDWELALQWFQDDKKKAQGLLPSLQLGQKQLLARRKQ
jgi:hypothetical protein